MHLNGFPKLTRISWTHNRIMLLTFRWKGEMDARQCQDYDYCLSYHYKYSDSKYEDTKQKVENEPGQRFNSQDTHHLR